MIYNNVEARIEMLSVLLSNSGLKKEADQTRSLIGRGPTYHSMLSAERAILKRANSMEEVQMPEDYIYTEEDFQKWHAVIEYMRLPWNDLFGDTAAELNSEIDRLDSEARSAGANPEDATAEGRADALRQANASLSFKNNIIKKFGKKELDIISLASNDVFGYVRNSNLTPDAQEFVPMIARTASELYEKGILTEEDFIIAASNKKFADELTRDIVKYAWYNPLDLLEDAGDAIADTARSAGRAARRAGSAAIDTAADVGRAAYDTAADVGRAAQRAGRATGDAVTEAGRAVQRAGSAVVDTVADAGRAAGSAVSRAYEGLGRVGSAALDAVGSAGRYVWNGVKRIGVRALKALPIVGLLFSAYFFWKHANGQKDAADALMNTLPLAKYDITFDEIGDASNISEYYQKLQRKAEEHGENPDDVLEIAKIFKHSKAYQLNVLLTWSNLIMLILDVVTVTLMAIAAILCATGVGCAAGAPVGALGASLAFMTGSTMFWTQIGLVVGELGAEAAAEAAYYNNIEEYINSIAQHHIDAATAQAEAGIVAGVSDGSDDQISAEEAELSLVRNLRQSTRGGGSGSAQDIDISNIFPSSTPGSQSSPTPASSMADLASMFSSSPTPSVAAPSASVGPVSLSQLEQLL